MGIGVRLKQNTAQRTPNDKKVRLRGDKLFIQFPKSKPDLDKVKRLTGAKLSHTMGNQLCWTALTDYDNIQRLENWGFELTSTVTQWVNSVFAPPVFKADFVVPDISHPLLPYQTKGVQTIDHWNGRCLIADDQGLGKTVQVLAWCYHRDAFPVIVTCPAFLKLNWKTEIEYWLPNDIKVQILNGRQEVDIDCDVLIVNYDILVSSECDVDDEHAITDKVRSDILGFDPLTLIVDEAHYVSNAETIRGWAVGEIAKRCDYVLPVTATPGARPSKIYPALHMTRPDLFPSFFRFAHKYCGAKKNAFGPGWNYNGSSNEIELHDFLKRSMMLRREKNVVFPDLDKKIRRVITFGLDNRVEYDSAANDFLGWCTEHKPHLKKGKTVIAEAFIKMEVLKQLAVKGRIKECIEWLWMMLETNDKIVVFCEHKEIVQILAEEFGSIAVVAVGGISGKKKDAAVTAFQRCKRCGVKKEYHARDDSSCAAYIVDLKTRVFIGSRAAKEGVTLTAAEHVAFMELWYTPQDHDQAEDRSYGRAGDLHGATAHYLIADNTVEEKVAEIYDLKNQMMNKVMNGRELLKEEMLTELIKEAL